VDAGARNLADIVDKTGARPVELSTSLV